jgi:outer membrane receptor protein involved in Fe transport/Flp pilus assembly protein TadD
MVVNRILTWAGLVWLLFGVSSWVAGQQPPPSSPPEAGTNSIVVFDVEGTVEFSPPAPTERWHPCASSEIVYPGYQIRTGARGRASVRLPDGTVVPMGPETRLILFPEREESAWIHLLQGFLYFFRRGPPGEYRVITPSHSTVTKGTEFSLAVDENGATVLHLFEGQVSLVNQAGTAVLKSGQAAAIKVGQAPVLIPFQKTGRAVAWRLYYPGILDLNEVDPSLDDRQDLRPSIEAYRLGDIQTALQRFPEDRKPADGAESVYQATLWLAVGNVPRAESILHTLASTPTAVPQPQAIAANRVRRLAEALRVLISAIQLEPAPPWVSPEERADPLATEWMAWSYLAQSQGKLEQAREAARKATQASPYFALAQTRLAEMEFSFGRTKAALKAVEKSLNRAPRQPQALALKGYLLAAQDRIAAAIDFFNQSMERDPALANAWLGRGLCRIRQGNLRDGLADLEAAAALEPQRSLLRAYLGKGFHETGDFLHADVELERARELDPADPTPWLYAALMDRERLRLNQAVRDLEQSQRLNKNRYLYRSRLLLDQDRSVRGANLAGIYQDAGMDEVSRREALRAVNADPANYSAHLFLADSYNRQRDPRQVDLRYETAWFTEYLTANLLAPAGASMLSPLVSQEEYSRLFERNRLGVVAATDYRSNGDWLQSLSQYGRWDGSQYALDETYRILNGQRRNNELEDLSLTLRLKQELSPQDSVYLQGIYYDAEAGDVARHYDPAEARPGLRVRENQEPILLAGYHHQWGPGSDTLVLAGWWNDLLRVNDPARGLFVVQRNLAGDILRVGLPQDAEAGLDYRNEFEAGHVEIQHLLRRGDHTWVAGARFQAGTIDTTSDLSGTTALLSSVTGSNPLLVSTAPIAQDTTADFDRASIYGYWTWSIAEPLQLTAGLAYDHLRYPENHLAPPISDGKETADQLSPKAGLVWTPLPDTVLRASYARSLGGVSFDQSVRLEPTQVGGFNQAYRGVIPESAAGSVIAPDFDTWGVAWDQKFPTGTYLGVEGQWLRSDISQNVGLVDVVIFPASQSTSLARENLDYEEKSLAVVLNQLIGKHAVLGGWYRFSEADLDQAFPGIPDGNGSILKSGVRSTLHQVYLYALAFTEAGWFGQVDSIWSQQSNLGYSPDRPGDDFWQFNLHVGYRFYRRRAEIRASLLNLADRDYRLNPLNLTSELPRDRTLALSLRFAF